MDLDRIALELKDARTPYCLATITKVEGSAPRHVGTKMIVLRDGSIHGTIGGGSLEEHVKRDAREALRLRTPKSTSYDLEEGAVQPCGGTVEVFLEPTLPARRTIVFGAGHIAEKLVPMLIAMDDNVTVVDERTEQIALPAFQGAERCNRLPQDFLPTCPFDDDLNLIVLTHQHVHDEAIVEYCLTKPLCYLGLISSRSKWALFCDRYREKGFTDAQLARVSTPIGLDIGAESPVEIAIAIAAELIQLRAKEARHSE